MCTDRKRWISTDGSGIDKVELWNLFPRDQWDYTDRKAASALYDAAYNVDINTVASSLSESLWTNYESQWAPADVVVFSACV